MTTTSTREPVTTPAALTRGDRKVIATLLVATFVVILNETIMGVALPRLMGDLSISARTVQWLTTAFMLTLAVVIPTTGFLLQRLSTKTVFVLAMGLFSAGTLLAAVSPAFWMLLPARIVQASGTALMIPLLMTTVLTLVPVQRRGVVMGNITIVISVAPAIGPTLSGLILQFLSWRFMFVLVLPIALAALFFGSRQLANVGEVGHQKLDLISVVLTIPAFGGVVYGLSQLGQGSNGSTLAVGFIVLGLVCLLAFGWRQRRLARGGSPLLDLGAFRYPMFSVSVTLLCLAMLALFGVVILLPIYLQTVRGFGSLATGLMLLPGGLTMGLLGPVVGRLFDRYGPRALSVLGATTLALTMFGLSRAGATTPVWMLVGLHVLLSGGLAFLFTPAFTTALNPLPPQLYSHGSAILTTLQQVAGAAGTAMLVAIMAGTSAKSVAAGVAEATALNGGIRTAFGVAALVSLAAIACAVFMRNETSEHGGPEHDEPTDAATSAEDAESIEGWPVLDAEPTRTS